MLAAASSRFCSSTTRQWVMRNSTTMGRVGSSNTRWMSVINLSDTEAVEKFLIMNSKVILYYTATWCGPCRQIKPIYEDLAKQYNGDVSFGKIDVDDNPDAAQEAQITAVPTFVGYVDEKPIVRFSGADTKQLQALAEQLKQHE